MALKLDPKVGEVPVSEAYRLINQAAYDIVALILISNLGSL